MCVPHRVFSGMFIHCSYQFIQFQRGTQVLTHSKTCKILQSNLQFLEIYNDNGTFDVVHVLNDGANVKKIHIKYCTLNGSILHFVSNLNCMK